MQPFLFLLKVIPLFSVPVVGEFDSSFSGTRLSPCKGGLSLADSCRVLLASSLVGCAGQDSPVICWHFSDGRKPIIEDWRDLRFRAEADKPLVAMVKLSTSFLKAGLVYLKKKRKSSSSAGFGFQVIRPCVKQREYLASYLQQKLNSLLQWSIKHCWSAIWQEDVSLHFVLLLKGSLIVQWSCKVFRTWRPQNMSCPGLQKSLKWHWYI